MTDTNLLTPQAPQAPAPPPGALDKGTTGADPMNNVMDEATHLGGPLGGAVIGALKETATHPSVNPAPPSSQDLNRTYAPEAPINALDKTPGADPTSVSQRLANNDASKPQPKVKMMAPSGRQTDVGDIDAADVAQAQVDGYHPVVQMTNPTTGKPGWIKVTDTKDALADGYIFGAPIKDNTTISPTPQTSAGDVVGTIASIPTNPLGVMGKAVDAATKPFTDLDQQGRAEHPIMAKVGDTIQAGEELLTGGQNAGKPLGTSSGVLNNPVTQALAAVPGAAETAAGIEGRIGGALESRAAAKAAEAANAVESGEVTEGMFKHSPEVPEPQHGEPVKIASPMDDATITKMAGGKDLTSEEMDALRTHLGGEPRQEIPVGSSPKNSLHRLSEPVQKTLTESGLTINKLVAKAPDFTSSVLDDGGIEQEIKEIRSRLPLKEEDPLNKVVDKQMEAAYSALESKNPQEILDARRAFGDRVNWKNLTKSPETSGQVQDLVQSKIYHALGDKLKEIDGLTEADKTYHINSHLADFLDKNGVNRDVIRANAEHLSELNKGRRHLATIAHNAKVDRNIKIALSALGLVGGGGIVGGAVHAIDLLKGSH